MKNDEKEFRAGEYATKHDYHRNLNLNWPYLPVYLTKLEKVERYLDRTRKGIKIFDAGCGEGILVTKYLERGYDIIGMDLNYRSDHVLQGNILETGFPDASFDLVMCLDVIEHLPFADQDRAFLEFYRLLKPGGKLLVSIPNLAHLASRLSFLIRGRLIRTSTFDRHPGDRPIKEYLNILQQNFKLIKRWGLFPTFPILSLLTLKLPSKVVGMHRIYNKLLGYPNWCFLNICLCEKLPMDEIQHN